MNVVAMQAAISGAVKAVALHTSAGAKWGAVASGLGVLLLLYLVTAAMSHHWNPRELVNGFDGFASTSKLQWFLWLVVIIFAYTALWVLRAEQSDWSALNKIPVNVLTVLGFSTGTAAVAKGITSGYVQTAKVTKPGPPQVGATAANTGGIFQDDSGAPELAKIQMMGFTIIAIGIFLATVIHQIVTDDISAGLPDIDASLLVLMGISQGGYLGKKLVTFGTPTLYTPDPARAAAGATVTLSGANLGTAGQLTMNGAPVATTSWSATSIGFSVPAVNPASGAAWTAPEQVVPLVASVVGQASNPVNFTVTS
jgi:IPT/TIG domain